MNDAEQMKAFFEATFKAQGVLLTEAAATKQNVVTALDGLVAQSTADPDISRVLISYSSHGTHIPDLDGDEVNGDDEALVCYDTKVDSNGIVRSSLIVDDEIYSILRQIPRNIVVDVWLDTCFSGDGLRIMGGEYKQARYFQNPGRRPVIGGGVLGSSFREYNAELPNVVLLSGCSEEETSADAYIGGKYYGAMTYSFLEQTKPGLCRNQTKRAMQKWLTWNGYEQHPQLEGSWSLRRGVYVEKMK